MNISTDMTVANQPSNLSEDRSELLKDFADDLIDYFKRLHSLHPLHGTSLYGCEGLLKDMSEIPPKLLQPARSIDDMLEFDENLHHHYMTLIDKEEKTPDGIYCGLCAPEVSSGGKLPGVFTYNVKESSTDENGDLTRSFRNLKTNVQKHYATKLHTEKTEGLAEASRQKSSSRNKRAGMNCARIAYSCIRNGHSFNSYPAELSKAKAVGVEIGDFNHSPEFPAHLVWPLYESLREEFIRQVDEPLPGTGRPSPITFIFDKYKSLGREYNIIGGNIFLGPNTKSLRTPFLQAYVVHDHAYLYML